MSRSHVSAARAFEISNPGALDTLAGGSSANTPLGGLLAERWLIARGVAPPPMQRWHVEIALATIDHMPPSEFDVDTATRCSLGIYSEEWGVFFCHRGRSSWIRVTDAVFVHGRDDFQLLGLTPPLDDIGRLVRHFEQQQCITFRRQHAAIRSNLPNAERAARAWVESF